ncbi:MAG: 1-deoxy-D-xylulose-5-phosphate synthase [Phycisphaerae bacterium]|nr:1-deoxy-D-xylulose-5-phosphate synthase [Phycisphaerae bacterium]
MSILNSISGPANLKSLSIEQLRQLAEEVRDLITSTVSQSGGHLASNLGVVDVTIALHTVFDFLTDRLLWDVGHQCYAHKILTGRKELFSQLRQQDGLSGFPSPQESAYDPFAVGHAGTSIATALGMALGAQHKRTTEKIVVVVGDASIVNGLSFEALNNLGLVKRQLLIILNDNSMAIDVTQGAIAKFLAHVRLSHTYEDIRRTTRRILENVPVIGRSMEGAIEKFKKTIRMQVSPSRLFESLNIPYFGPVDGHDIGALIELFRAMNHLDTPAILHVYTKKGHGFEPADANPRKFHSTGPFEINGNSAGFPKVERSFTDAFAEAITELAQRDNRIMAITAAMPDGTGLVPFRERFPDRCFDIGIAESVAVDAAAGMAKQGLRPVVCIYSTFLQRSFDQIFQEVSLQDLPVIFCIDRAGVVGNDGPTHHGLYDIGFMRMLPNLIVACPASEAELKSALEMAVGSSHPVAIRYPKDVVPNGRLEPLTVPPMEAGKSISLRTGGDIVLIGIGPVVIHALDAAERLTERGIEVGVINARFAKPIDDSLIDFLGTGKTLIVLEDHTVAAGFASALMEQSALRNIQRPDREAKGRILPLACPDAFIPAGPRKVQLESFGISEDRIVNLVLSLRS